MSYQPIENYGIIGNMRTVALVGMNGAIDWFCYPHFDSPSIFGAILDDNKGSRFQICPVGDGRCRGFVAGRLGLVTSCRACWGGGGIGCGEANSIRVMSV